MLSKIVYSISSRVTKSYPPEFMSWIYP